METIRVKTTLFCYTHRHMYDLVSLGDIKLDVFIGLDRCKEKCSLAKKNVCFNFGEKILIELQDQQIAGSAPNVATALARMGKKTAVVSHMGQDQTHTRALIDLKREHVAIDFILAHKGLQSAYSAVLGLQGERTILVSYIHRPYHLPKTLETKWLYMSEMGDGYETIYKEVLKRIKKEKTLLGFNPGNEQIEEAKPELYDLIRETKTLFVNLEEAQTIAKNKRLKIESLAVALFKLGPTEVVITDGKNGSYGFDGTNLFVCPIFPGNVLEATGAGDAFAAAYIGARMHGHGMSDGLRWGAVNASSVIEMVGPVPGLLTHKEILKRLRTNPTFVPKKLV